MNIKVTPLEIPDILVLEPRVFDDERGFFYECFNEKVFHQATGIHARFVQDNHSFSHCNVLRGLHYQLQQAQGKLIQVFSGEIFDVAVDLRRKSPTFGRSVSYTLHADQRRSIWIPPGFAHGFLVTADSAQVSYKVTEYWAPGFERKILWNDPDLAIRWPLRGEPVLSAPDRAATRFSEAELFE